MDFVRCCAECCALPAGLLLDPLEGLRQPRAFAVLGFIFGLCKGVLGVGWRPTAGIIEGIAKILLGIGLLCLGKRGIQVGWQWQASRAQRWAGSSRQGGHTGGLAVAGRRGTQVGWQEQAGGG